MAVIVFDDMPKIPPKNVGCVFVIVTVHLLPAARVDAPLENPFKPATRMAVSFAVV